MQRISIVTSPPPTPGIALHEYESVQFVPIVDSGPDMRALLNTAPVLELDPYPLSNPSYMAGKAQ